MATARLAAVLPLTEPPAIARLPVDGAGRRLLAFESMRWAGCVVLFLVAGCGSSVVAPSVRPRSATVTAVGTSGLSMRVALSIHNPNSMDLTVTSIRAHVTAQGQDLGTVEPGTGVRLVGQRETAFETDIVVPWTGLPSLGLGAVLAGSIPYTVDGVVRVSGPAGITMEAPFQMEGEMPASLFVPIPGLQ